MSVNIQKIRELVKQELVNKGANYYDFGIRSIGGVDVETVSYGKSVSTAIVVPLLELASDLNVIGKARQTTTSVNTNTNTNTNNNTIREFDPSDPIVITGNNNVANQYTGRVYTRLNSGDVVYNEVKPITKGIFSCNSGSMLTFFTGSTTDNQKRYYINVHNKLPDDCLDCDGGSEPQFSIAYGHVQGLGETLINLDYPTKAIYSQYRSLLLDPGDSLFTIGGIDKKAIFAISFYRTRMKDKMDEGNWEINLQYTGSTLRLIDDSELSDGATTKVGTVYKVVSGSIADGIYTPDTPVEFGLFYPDLGIIILDADTSSDGGTLASGDLQLPIAATENSGSGNTLKLFNALSASAADPSSSLGINARSVEKIVSTNYWIRVKNAEYNFSNNPTFINETDGTLAQASFIGDPKTYITGIGLYNDNYELLAVAKVSTPVLKTFNTELLFRIKLDF